MKRAKIGFKATYYKGSWFYLGEWKSAVWGVEKCSLGEWKSAEPFSGSGKVQFFIFGEWKSAKRVLLGSGKVQFFIFGEWKSAVSHFRGVEKCKKKSSDSINTSLGSGKVQFSIFGEWKSAKRVLSGSGKV